jgi:hypothetical protein
MIEVSDIAQEVIGNKAGVPRWRDQQTISYPLQSMIFRPHTSHIVQGEEVLEFCAANFSTGVNRTPHG